MATSMTATAVEPAAIVVDDEETRLIERAQAGDREAFGQLYLRHRPSVLHFTLSRLNNLADAEDIVAETFATVLSTIDAFRGETDFVGWLNGIARKKTLARWDWQRRHPETELPPEWSPVFTARMPSPEEMTCLRLELTRLLSRMAPRTRQMIVLRHLVGLSSDEVGRRLGLSKWTVWHLSQANAALNGTPKRARVLPPALCVCGCGVELPADRQATQRCATRACRDRLRCAVRPALQQRYLAAPASTDPAIDRVLAVIAAAGPDGITRRELGRRTRLVPERLDRIVALLAARGRVGQQRESVTRKPTTRYHALPTSAAGRAA